jgi:hypothetical protein
MKKFVYHSHVPGALLKNNPLRWSSENSLPPVPDVPLEIMLSSSSSSFFFSLHRFRIKG